MEVKIRDESRGMILIAKRDDDSGECELRIHGPQGGFKTYLRLNSFSAIQLAELLTDEGGK